MRLAYDLRKSALIPFCVLVAIFSMDGNTPDEKDRLDMSAR